MLSSSPAPSDLLRGTLHPKRTGHSYKFLPLLFHFLESILIVHQRLLRGEVVLEHQYLENHLVHTIYHYEMLCNILNGADPSLL